MSIHVSRTSTSCTKNCWRRQWRRRSRHWMRRSWRYAQNNTRRYSTCTYCRRTGIQWRWEEHHKLAQTKERLEQGVNPNTLDEKFRMAWKTFKGFKKFHDALYMYQKYPSRVKRKEPPKQWKMSRILDKSNRDSGRMSQGRTPRLRFRCIWRIIWLRLP